MWQTGFGFLDAFAEFISIIFLGLFFVLVCGQFVFDVGRFWEAKSKSRCMKLILS